MILRTIVATLALGGVAFAQEIKSDDLIGSLETSYEKASDKAAASVVAIKVDRDPEAAPKSTIPSPLRRFGPPEDVFARRPVAWCSGLIVESSGTILTTYFNVSGKVRSVKVKLSTGQELEAQILGYSATFDLAALKVEGQGLPVLKKARLEDLKVGQPLVALGRAPDGKGLTVNPGIISAASRLAGKGIQIDSKLNYGNVGGPVVDLEGRLVAISCKVDIKYASMFGQNSGVGFAITHDRFMNVLADLKAGKNDQPTSKPFLGIEAELSSDREGVELKNVRPNTAADKAGIKTHDVIIEFDGHKIARFDDLHESILRKSPGDRVKIKVLRGEDELEFDCTLGEALDE